MTNESKAIEIYNRETDKGFHLGTHSLVEMAEWKDAQFKEYLEQKNTEISNTKAKLDKTNIDYMLCTLKSLFIDEIINELFKEE